MMVTVSPGLSQRFGLRPRPTPGRCAGRHDIARQQRRDGRKIFNELRDFEDQLAGIGVLQHFAVDGEADVECVGIGDFVGGDDGWPERAEGGEALAHRPLGARKLHVAGADVVDDGVAVDVITPC